MFGTVLRIFALNHAWHNSQLVKCHESSRIFFTHRVTRFIDDLSNDSFVWNAAINFHCLFQDLMDGHFHDLLCRVSSTSVSRIISSTSSSVSFSRSFMTDGTA